VVEHAADLVAVLGADADAALQDLPHRSRHAAIDFQAHRVAEATSPQLLLDGEEQVVRLVLLELEVGVAGDAEEVRLADLMPEKSMSRLAAITCSTRTNLLGSISMSRASSEGTLTRAKTLLAVVGILDPDRQGQAERADVRERMPGIHGQRREHRVDLVGEALPQGIVVLGHLVVSHDRDAGLAERGADSLEGLALLQQHLADLRVGSQPAAPPQACRRGWRARPSPGPAPSAPRP
jgi:hypothetical protein